MQALVHSEQRCVSNVVYWWASHYKAFGRKFSKSKKGSKIDVLGFRWGKFWYWSLDPQEINPRRTTSFDTKTLTLHPKCVSRAWREVTKNIGLKIKKKHWTWYFTPMPRRPCMRGRFSQFLACGIVESYRLRNHPCQIWNRLVKGFMGYGCPKFSQQFN